jgi:hypothetical protein
MSFPSTDLRSFQLLDRHSGKLVEFLETTSLEFINEACHRHNRAWARAAILSGKATDRWRHPAKRTRAVGTEGGAFLSGSDLGASPSRSLSVAGAQRIFDLQSGYHPDQCRSVGMLSRKLLELPNEVR